MIGMIGVQNVLFVQFKRTFSGFVLVTCSPNLIFIDLPQGGSNANAEASSIHQTFPEIQKGIGSEPIRSLV